MIRVRNKFLGALLVGVLSITSITGLALSQDIKVVHATSYPGESKAFIDALLKVNHLKTSLKTNYLGIKNQGTWQLYISEARELMKKIPSHESSKRSLLEADVNKSEALVNALARINQVEKSIQPKSEGGYGNYLGIKNAETWNGYLKLAKIDLEKVDKGIFKKQYDELIDRMGKVSLVVKDIEDKFQDEYDKVVKLYEEAKSSGNLGKANEALVEAEKLGTCDRSDKLEEDIKQFINDASNKISKIDDIKETLNQGSKFNLPSKVKATFNNGSIREVQVKWNTTRVNTDSLGIQTFEGTVQGYDKKVKATIEIIIYETNKSILDYNKKESEHFVLYYTDNENSVVDNIIETLEENYNRIINDLKINPEKISQKFRVDIYPNYDMYYENLKKIINNMPSGTSGTSIGQYHIAIISPINPGIGRSYESMLQVVLHEFAHSASRIINPSIVNNPRWLSEGIACYEAKQKRKVNKPYPTLSDLNDRNKGREYEAGYALIDYIEKNWSMDKVIELIKTNGDINSVLGISVDEFEKSWYDFMDKNQL